MMRVLRILVYGAAAVSCLLCVAAAILWVRSQWVQDGFYWKGSDPPYYVYECGSRVGVLFAERAEFHRPPPPGYEFNHWSLKMDAQMAAANRESFARKAWHGFFYEHLDPP